MISSEPSKYKDWKVNNKYFSSAKSTIQKKLKRIYETFLSLIEPSTRLKKRKTELNTSEEDEFEAISSDDDDDDDEGSDDDGKMKEDNNDPNSLLPDSTKVSSPCNTSLTEISQEKDPQNIVSSPQPGTNDNTDGRVKSSRKRSLSSFNNETDYEVNMQSNEDEVSKFAFDESEMTVTKFAYVSLVHSRKEKMH